MHNIKYILLYFYIHPAYAPNTVQTSANTIDAYTGVRATIHFPKEKRKLVYTYYTPVDIFQKHHRR